jgi:energy-coupling factor transporter ATP-binding protein EcfA2
MATILEQLSQWAGSLKYWEQAALEKIVTGTTFTDNDYEELLRYLLEGEKLQQPIGPHPVLEFPTNHSTSSTNPTSPVQLGRICNLQNVNAVVSGQILTFARQLTMIFGGNGCGKSSYARVLACSAFARGEHRILPDIGQPVSTHMRPSADIEICDSQGTRVVRYEGNRCHELSGFYVFDTTSAQVHLTAENKLSFSPAGLSFLTQLAEVTDKVRIRLQERVTQCLTPHNFALLFQCDSEIKQIIVTLGPRTNLIELRKLATLTSEELSHIAELESQIIELKSQKIPEQVSDIKQSICDLRKLDLSLKNVELLLSDDVVAEVSKLVSEHNDRQKILQLSSIDQFRSQDFNQTGSSLWHSFIESANALALSERSAETAYPQKNDHCLLCHQSLTPEAYSLIKRLWQFLEAEAQSNLDETKLALGTIRTGINTIRLDFFDENSVSRRQLTQYGPELVEPVDAFLERYKQRRFNLLQLIDTLVSQIGVTLTPESITPQLEIILSQLSNKLSELEALDRSKQIEELTKQKLVLEHRKLLSEHWDEIEKYVNKRIWADRASRVGGSTKHITQKHNELFKELVTDPYLQTFEQTLRELKHPIKVKVQTKGRKGDTLRQIVLETDPSKRADNNLAENVLSEGEKRAVALADFLTEVVMDNTSCGIVLDDPVTSLDFEWKATIAERLVTEAKRRQVIVFTHDLHFLYLMTKCAQEQQIQDVQTHWIRRGEIDNKPGYVFLNNGPAVEQSYKDTKIAKKEYDKARACSPEEQETFIKAGFGALRTTYEAFIVFELFAGVIMRFDERISPGRLKDIVWDQTIVNEVINKYEVLSRYIEGHLHSNLAGAQKPTLKMLNDEIDAFDNLKKRYRAIPKST